MRKFVAWFAFTFISVGCGSSSSTPTTKKNGDATAATYQLEYSDVMEFTRGVAGSYRLAGHFTNDKEARLTVDGLPPGAEYVDDQISWTPSCELKPENGQFIRGYLVRRIRINLASTISDDIVQKTAILIVHKDGPESPCGKDAP